MTERTERNEKIYILRENGATLSDIAKMYNINRERVRQIYFREKERKEDNPDSYPPFKKLLSKRIQTVLKKHFKGEHIFYDPQRIANLGKNKIRRIRNIGKKSIRELAISLHTLGLIKQNDEWFEP